MIHAEIISIGDELSSGQRLDTNSQWLSQQLGDLGVRVLFHTTVGDELEANVQVFQMALGRADIVIATGGLGPTADDLTREAVAGATGKELVLDEAVLGQIESRFFRQARSMPQSNRVQAMFPAGCQVIPNPHGTAPGIDVEVQRHDRGPSRLFALPGVPAEMREMWNATVEPRLGEIPGVAESVIVHRRIKCFGAGESHLEQMLPDLIRRGRQPSVGITVHKATITLRVTAAAPTREEAVEQIQPTWALIHEQLGQLVYGQEDDELQHAVAQRLRARGENVAVAECGTRGMVAQWLGNVPQQEDFFQGAVVCTPTSQGAGLFSEHGIPEFGSENSVQAMALAVREHFGTDWGLAVGEFPSREEQQQGSGEFCLALAGDRQMESRMRRFAGHPDILLERSAKQALDLLRLRLLREDAAD
ncbi:MAG: damage-inducible protein CinA [Planctomycetaceae bacterium]|nr:damage-inducible protein CinA [Planctomycetaceae bacterium]